MGAQHILSNVVDLLLDTVFLVDMEGRIVFVNPACERLLGYTPAELVGQTLFGLLAPEDREKTERESLLVMSGEPRTGFENRYRHKDGHLVDIMWSACFDATQQLRIGVARDISERRRVESMQLSLHELAAAMQNADSAPALFTEFHRLAGRLMPIASMMVIELLPQRDGFTMMYPAHGHEHGRAAWQHIEPMCSDALRHRHAILIPGQASWMAAPLFTGSDGGSVLLLESGGADYTLNDRDVLQFISAQLATAMERHRLIRELTRSAQFDDLTGLPNRRLFYDRLESALIRCHRYQEQAAILYLDVNSFKEVNDTHGHLAGDEVLKAIATRLRQAVREEDTVARLGGDEFVILLPKVDSMDSARMVAEKIRRTSNQCLSIGPVLLQPSVSIGIALFPEHGENANQLIRHADQSMYAEKSGNS
jgi:diguanylate cyclase (GGDEF)-like protein/PAS domain S-box-containing protein